MRHLYDNAAACDARMHTSKGIDALAYQHVQRRRTLDAPVIDLERLLHALSLAREIISPIKERAE